MVLTRNTAATRATKTTTPIFILFFPSKKLLGLEEETLLPDLDWTTEVAAAGTAGDVLGMSARLDICLTLNLIF
jgi:hypothetical protein